MENIKNHKMDLRNTEETKESLRNENAEVETDRVYFGCGNDTEEQEYQNSHSQSKDGAVPPKPSDVRNGDLVSLLLAATPPYLYNIPLVPQTFFFSEMLKSFVQAKTERQNLKAQQSHHRRQRKRSWREVTPPKPMPYEMGDKPLELTTTKQMEEKAKITEKVPVKKFHPDTGEKKFQPSEFANSNFSVEKLANSSITTGNESNNVISNDLLPPAPPLWYPLLYPPHPPYGIDPLHFFIDLRVSAHFWDRKLATDKINNETVLTTPPLDLHSGNDTKEVRESPETSLGLKSRQNSAFSVPSMTRKETFRETNIVTTRKNSQNVHYVMSSLKNIYKALDEREETKESKKEEKADEEENKEKRCKDLRALIGLELVVDYVKQESDGEEEEQEEATEPATKYQTVCIE